MTTMKNDRLISLNAALDEVESIVDTMSVCVSMEECKGMRSMKQRVLERIKALPSAKPVEDIMAMCGECDAWNQYKNYPQPGWISVTERLPEANEEDEKGFRKAYLVQTGRIMQTARYDGKYWILWGEMIVVDSVVAWMPLPKPWEGDTDAH